MTVAQSLARADAELLSAQFSAEAWERFTHAHLAAVGRWARDEGPAPYPLAQGCQDHALGLAIEESARTRADVRVTKEVWV